ncbi:MAG: DUF2088 domain-containing protein [Bacillota bacterium]|nr:DUF2088 domain-containing protein [Bacillota bacterium]
MTIDNGLRLPRIMAQQLLTGQRQIALPRVVEVRQLFAAPVVADIAAAVRLSCEAGGLGARLRPGLRIGVACGSRGISGLPEIVAALLGYLREHGAEPLLLPAMGSHGGPSAEGQRQVLEGYGISERELGAPVLSSLDTHCLGVTDNGIAVHFSADALSLDGVIPVNRIKAHTDFSAATESGVMKMCAIGLGKHQGATAIHAAGFPELGENVRSVARIILEKANVWGGIGIVENAYKQVAAVEYLPQQHIEPREEELLRYSKSLMPSLPAEDIDVLLVQRMGKDISGAGFDPNITGRRKIPSVADLPEPRIRLLAALELTEASHGNAAGIGVADICSARLLEHTDWPATYASLITATLPQHAHMPMYFSDDRQLLMAACQCASPAAPEQAGLMWIRDTAHLERLYVSENMLPRLRGNAKLQIADAAIALPFDEHELLSWPQ